MKSTPLTWNLKLKNNILYFFLTLWIGALTRVIKSFVCFWGTKSYYKTFNLSYYKTFLLRCFCESSWIYVKMPNLHVFIKFSLFFVNLTFMVSESLIDIFSVLFHFNQNIVLLLKMFPIIDDQHHDPFIWRLSVHGW